MKTKFRSSDYFFRPTSLSERLSMAGLSQPLGLVREPVIEATLRDKNDRGNAFPSRKIHIKPSPSVDGAFGKVTA